MSIKLNLQNRGILRYLERVQALHKARFGDSQYPLRPISESISIRKLIHRNTLWITIVLLAAILDGEFASHRYLHPKCPTNHPSGFELCLWKEH